MISDRVLAGLCADSYDNSIVWDHIYPETDISLVWAAIKKIDNTDVIVFRGSVTPEDWFQDFQAVPIYHNLLGGVEKGFLEGLDEIYAKVSLVIGKNPIVTGHSLGAARACIFGGLLAATNNPPAATVGFGCPRPGYDKLTEILEPIPVRLYRNRYDPVTEVPVPVPLLCPWQHPRYLIHLSVPPLDDGVLADHNITLYQAGVPS